MYGRRQTGHARLVGVGIALLGMLLAVLILTPGKAASPGEGSSPGGAGPSGAVNVEVTPTPEPPNPYPRGSRIRTTDDVNLRNGPSLTNPVLMTVVSGSDLVVQDGPVEADNYRWWRVQSPSGPSSQGWMAEGGWWELTVGPPEAPATATPAAQ